MQMVYCCCGNYDLAVHLKMTVFTKKLRRFVSKIFSKYGLTVLETNKYNLIRRSAFYYRRRRSAFYYRTNKCLKYFFGDKLIVLDVGANNGNVLENIASNFKNSTLYGVEPNKSLIPKLEEKFGSSAQFFNLGLGSNQCQGKLYITEGDELASELKPNVKFRSSISKYNQVDTPLNLRETQEFEKITGDLFMNKYAIDRIDYLSLNTQGTELEILKGFSDSLKNHKIKTIQIEIDVSDRYQPNLYGLLDVEKFFSKFNYKLLDIITIKDVEPVGFMFLHLLYKCPNLNPYKDFD